MKAAIVMAEPIRKEQLTEFALQVYTEQKDSFVDHFSKHLQERIDSGLAQFENGEYMSFGDFESKFRQEYLSE